MANRVIKIFRDKTNDGKLYRPKTPNYEGDVYESKDSKRIAFLIEEGFLEAGESVDLKKGKSSKKAGE